MKKIATLLLLTSLFFSSCYISTSHEPAQPLKEANRHVATFERIELLGSPSIYYTQGDSISIRVEAPQDIIEYVETEVEDGKLTVCLKNNIMNQVKNLQFMDGEDIKVFVTSPDLIEIKLLGSGDFYCQGHLDTDNLNIELRGSGDIEFDDIICDQVGTQLMGSGDIEVKHVRTGSSSVELVGSGDVKMAVEGAQSTNINLRGSGDVKMTLNNRGSVQSTVHGSGDVTLKGNVNTLQSSTIGSGEHHTEELLVARH